MNIEEIKNTPDWAWDLLAAVIDFEETHGQVAEGHQCLQPTLARVPIEATEALELVLHFRRTYRPGIEEQEREQ